MKDKKAHGVELLIRAIVRDPDGKILSDTGRKPSKSFIIQFLEFIYGMFNKPASLKATDRLGDEDDIYLGASDCLEHFRADAALGAGYDGIVVGTGTTPETNTDHKLETQIWPGTGVGELSYGTSTVEVAAVVGANVDLKVTRTLINGSGATITVTEAGIYADCPGGKFCITRDVLAEEQPVPHLCSLTVIYTLRTTV